jgi:hypothetical protein
MITEIGIVTGILMVSRMRLKGKSSVHIAQNRMDNMKIFSLNGTLIVALMLLSANGCNVRTAYDGLRFHQDLDCQKMMGASERDDCYRRSGMSYDDYERRRKNQEQQK